MDWPGKGHVHRDWFGLAAFRPGPKFLRDGGTLYLLESVGSTSEFLLGRGHSAEGRLCSWDGWGWNAALPQELAPIEVPRPGTVVVARQQVAGRGRQGRTWRDCGGLNLSVVVPPHRAVMERGFSVWLGLITVLALRENFQLDARLKWPNDIMVHGRKIGGILVQRSGLPDNHLVVAGLGLNLVTEPGQFPAELQGAATSMSIETDCVVGPGEISGHIVARVEGELDRFQAEGWDAYRPALALLDCLLGREVRLSVGDQVHTGRAVGIDDSGGLLIETGVGDSHTGRRSYHAGDVHLLPTTADRAGGDL